MINSTINPSNLIWIFNVNFLMGTLAVVEPSVSWPIDYFKSPKAKNKPFFLHNRFPGFSNTGMQAFLFYEGRSVNSYKDVSSPLQNRNCSANYAEMIHTILRPTVGIFLALLAGQGSHLI